ncbi:GspH/FimT family pseudopilin [Marinicella gelatinilytica]|uniref:GspH/FimT family pseudopilin n=1 Tax=Marinicella gelatinilytica TaxID=2996017 RepID=UPI002260B661|nr:GspH/FimT family protein [Marinicella gelatinilytica]MCX7544585.1 GspH/FimT family protein [Marinicella gelatinilytica]
MKVRGFTLIELIITLLIGSLLLAWGVPNYRDFKIRREVVDNTNEFVYSMNLARAEAVRYGTTVTVAPVNNDWSEGWITMATGLDGNPDFKIEEHDPVNNIVVTFTTNPGGSLSFTRIGGLSGSSEAVFSLTHANATASRNVRIGMSGSVRVEQP